VSSRTGSLAFSEDFLNKPKKSFFAYSGVSEAFLNAGAENTKSFTSPAWNFIFVGSLINRKHPTEIITALSKAYPEGNFTMTYIGDGADKPRIEEEYKKQGEKGTHKFTGRIPREEIVEYLKQADVFIMISKGEIFGLVYLEAMALGVIPVGSKHEGIDGVIVDGENGFLCEAGNSEELVAIISKIKNLSADSLQQLSKNAIQTANAFSDYGVAKQYINNLVCS
jgi:glycosyltransferase involved in cell wall biosynthesis